MVYRLWRRGGCYGENQFVSYSRIAKLQVKRSFLVTSQAIESTRMCGTLKGNAAFYSTGLCWDEFKACSQDRTSVTVSSVPGVRFSYDNPLMRLVHCVFKTALAVWLTVTVYCHSVTALSGPFYVTIWRHLYVALQPTAAAGPMTRGRTVRVWTSGFILWSLWLILRSNRLNLDSPLCVE
jgi:hypothetical protein